MLGRVGGLLRYQVLLTLFALDILGLGAGHVNICGVGAVLQQVMEGVQVVRLRSGGNRGDRRKERRRGRRKTGREERDKEGFLLFYRSNIIHFQKVML